MHWYTESRETIDEYFVDWGHVVFCLLSLFLSLFPSPFSYNFYVPLAYKGLFIMMNF